MSKSFANNFIPKHGQEPEEFLDEIYADAQEQYKKAEKALNKALKILKDPDSSKQKLANATDYLKSHGLYEMVSSDDISPNKWSIYRSEADHDLLAATARNVKLGQKPTHWIKSSIGWVQGKDLNKGDVRQILALEGIRQSEKHKAAREQERSQQLKKVLAKKYETKHTPAEMVDCLRNECPDDKKVWERIDRKNAEKQARRQAEKEAKGPDTHMPFGKKLSGGYAERLANCIKDNGMSQML